MKIGLFRESGGLGDVICTGGAVRRLQEEGHEVWFVGLHEYQIAAKHLGYNNAYWLDTSVRIVRRDRSDLIRPDKAYTECLEWLELDRTYDLFCPGWEHEKVVAEYSEDQHINRIEAFQKACGFQKDFVRPMWTVTKEEKEMADKWFKAKNIEKPEDHIILHFDSTDEIRSYPDHAVKELCDLLKGKDIRPILIDSELRATRYGKNAVICWQEPLDLKAAIMQRVGRIVCIDSGFLHLAGALGMQIFSLWGSTDGKQTTKLYERNTSVHANTYFEETVIRKLALCEKCGKTMEIKSVADLKTCKYCHSMNSLKRADGKPKFDENYVVTCIPPCRIPPPFCRGRTCKWLERISPYRVLGFVLGERQ